MSRTHRKPKFLIEETLVQHLNNTRKNYARRAKYGIGITRQIKTRKSAEQYAADVAAADARYQADCCAVRKRFWYPSTDSVQYEWYLKSLPERWRYSVSKFYYRSVTITLEEELEEARADYAKRTRDGYWNESGRNTAYKTLSKETVRQVVRRLEHKILRDEQWDHQPYPDTYLGKKHIWDVW
jgi:hypothetical protein